jgi:cyclophilin family peptidyl-prolyl cis-trans isomerase
MANPTAVFETSKGTIRAEIFRDQMPITAGNFLKLVEMGFYDGLHFHRVIENFMVQMGCPHSKDPHHSSVGTGDSPLGTIADEFLKTAKLSNEPGTLSMANAGPDTGGSQFFINCAHNKQLDWFRWFGRKGQHPVFGLVTQGMDVVQNIECATVDEWDVPVEPVKIERISIEEP